MTFATLQLRLVNASLHIRKFLQTVQRMYGLTPPDLVLVLSTRSSVRSEYGREAPRVELAKLLARPDYGAVADTIHAEARSRLIKDADLPPRDSFTGTRRERFEAHHVTLPASPAPGSESSKVSMPANTPIVDLPISIGLRTITSPPKDKPEFPRLPLSREHHRMTLEKVKAMLPFLPDLTNPGITVRRLPGMVVATEELEVEVEELQEAEEEPEAVGTVVRPLTWRPNPPGCLLTGNSTASSTSVWFPTWDGHGKTVIDYLCSVAELTRLSPQMIVDLGLWLL
ncbi:hypothetical protein B0H14DRAFT_3512048 [Mycena olivaceomarginata]|nr:hypothetical protein B0H14DRAFT_3512048 [Mycena olivaceomarginata]